MPIKKLFLKEGEKAVSSVDDLDGILAGMQLDTTNEIPEEYDYDSHDYDFEASDSLESVEDFYVRIEMTDNKIYDVIKFIDGIPSSIDSVTRKITLMNMLNLSNYVVDELVDNADKCINALKQGAGVVQSSTDSMVAETENKIANMLAEIDVLRNDIEESKKICETQKTLFKEEVEKIEAIKNHIM